jgi:hypothetical protein
MSKEKDNSICTDDIDIYDCVKRNINEIAFDTNYTEQERKEKYNEFYDYLLTSTGKEPGKGEIRFSIEDLCYLAKTDGNNKHLWGNTKDARDKDVIGDQYTPEIAKMYNILTSSLAVLCNSIDDSCNFEDMKKLQLEILKKTNKLVIKGLGNIDMELNNTIRMIRSKNDNLKGPLEGRKQSKQSNQLKPGIISGIQKEQREQNIIKKKKEKQQEYLDKRRGIDLRNLAAIFGASYEFINNTIITPANVEVFAGIINKMIFIMQHPIDTFFGALDCYNRFLISAIGNKLTTILNSITIAGLTLGGAGLIVHAALVDTLNEQNLLQSAATLYYYSQFLEPMMKTLSEAVNLGDSIKIHLMTKIPNLTKEKIGVVANTIRYYINKIAKPTEEMTLEHTEKVVKDITNITNITEIIEKAIPADKINKGDVKIVKNDENKLVKILNPKLIMDPEDRRSLESYLNKDAEEEEVEEYMNEEEANRAAAAAAGLKEGTGQGTSGGGKKHKKSHKKRHQKTHKKQLKPKAKSHKKKNKPKVKSHKKK